MAIPTYPGTTTTPTPGSTTSSTTTTAASVASSMGLAWSLPLFEHYLGREPSYKDLQQVRQGGFNYDMLVEHLRNQPSHVKGLTIGALEDYHKDASGAFFKWTGREATDSDIQQLVNNGVKSAEDIDKYIRNRADVVAAHPGAPIDLSDEQYGQHKAAIDSDYQANLGRASTDQEARDAYSQAASPFRRQPAEQFGLNSGVTKESTGPNTGALISQAQISPNSRLGLTG